MASPQAEAHRRAQLKLGALTVAQMRAIWPLFDPEDIDSSFPQWLLAAVPVVAASRRASARLAANYLAVDKAQTLGAGLVPIYADDLPAQAVSTSLLVTGPVSVKRAMSRGASVAAAASTAEGATAAAAMRHALNGGRETISRTVHADRDARGWVRVASGNACEFCSTLDGKFHKDDTADFEAHDGCSCSQEPVWG